MHIKFLQKTFQVASATAVLGMVLVYINLHRGLLKFRKACLPQISLPLLSRQFSVL